MIKSLNKLLENLIIAIFATIVIHLSLIDWSTVCLDTLEETCIPLLETASNNYTPSLKTEYIPRLLDLEYYTSSDFDVPIHLDPRLDPGLNLNLNVVEIADSSLYPNILTQDILEAEVDEVIYFCNTQKQSFLDLRNMGINHPFVEANIRLAEATLSQIDAAQEVHSHKVSFLETYILPERWDHYMNN